MNINICTGDCIFEHRINDPTYNTTNITYVWYVAVSILGQTSWCGLIFRLSSLFHHALPALFCSCSRSTELEVKHHAMASYCLHNGAIGAIMDDCANNATLIEGADPFSCEIATVSLDRREKVFCRIAKYTQMRDLSRSAHLYAKHVATNYC